MALPARPTAGNPIPAEWGIQVVDALEAHEARILANTLIGEMKIWPGDTEPPGFLFCRGQLVSRTTYASLFAIVGTKFGAGDGSTNFAVPNMQGMVPVGINVGTAIGIVGTSFSGSVGQFYGTPHNSLPAHAHGGGWHAHGINVWTGGENTDHAHWVSLNTGGVSELHSHRGYAGNQFVSYEPGAGLGTGAGAATDFIPRPTTNWEEQNHYHGVSGMTGGRSAGHVHAINSSSDGAGIVTDTQGTSSSNANIQPSMFVNYIIKAAIAA